MDITDRWVKFATNVALEADPKAYAQERVFTTGTGFTVKGKQWERGITHSLVDLGYSKAGSKMTQLKRDYYNEDSVKEAKSTINSRHDQSVSSVGISTLGGKKKNAQGHCIRSVVINHFDEKVSPFKQSSISIDVFYRTTELLRKFGADLIFLKEFLIPEILYGTEWQRIDISEIRFYFSSCFFSALFIPVLYQFVDPVWFLKRLKESRGDVIFYRRCLFRTKTMLERSVDNYKFRSRRNMHELAENFMGSGKINREKLETYLKEELK